MNISPHSPLTAFDWNDDGYDPSYSTESDLYITDTEEEASIADGNSSNSKSE